MAKIIEIKTPNCSHCKQIEPLYQELQQRLPDNEYIVKVFGTDPDAAVLAKKYNIHSAPTFIVEFEDETVKVVKFEELEQTLVEHV